MLLRRFALLLALAPSLAAQDFMDPYGDQEEVAFHFGVSAPLGVTAQNLDWGFMAGMSGVFWVKPKFGIQLEGTYQRLLMARSLVAQFPPTKDGTCEVWSILAHAVWHFGPPQEGFYVMAGGGVGYRRLNFYSDEPIQVPIQLPPGQGWVGLPVGVPPSEQVNTTRPAASVGLGWETPVKGGFRVFVELRYERVFTRDVATEMMPLLFGTRW